MIPFNKREKMMLVIIIVSFLFFVSYEFYTSFQTEIPPFEEQLQEGEGYVEPNELVEKREEEQVQDVVVDIKGAVEKPGVYTISKNARVNDVVEKAGGALPQANLSQVNLAIKVYDEMMIYIPTVGEEINKNADYSSIINSSGKISINQADESQLVTLDGIGPAKANAIIAYRQENGPFKSVDDLLHVSGIGQKTLDAIKEKIVVH